VVFEGESPPPSAARFGLAGTGGRLTPPAAVADDPVPVVGEAFMPLGGGGNGGGDGDALPKRACCCAEVMPPIPPVE